MQHSLPLPREFLPSLGHSVGRIVGSLAAVALFAGAGVVGYQRLNPPGSLRITRIPPEMDAIAPDAVDQLVTFVQSKGVHTTGDLTLGDFAAGHGTYTLSGGSLLVSGGAPVRVGRDGTGTFIQTGGSFNISAPHM